MIRSIYKDALISIQKAEQKINLETTPTIEQSFHMITLLRNTLSTLKSHVLEQGFSDESEEIEFFKAIKPKILGKLIYYNKVFRIETSCPTNIGEISHNFFYDKLRELKQEYNEDICNTDFYQYYRSGRTDRDNYFFRLGNIDLHTGLNSFVFEVDLQFSTYYDYKVSRIIANDLLYLYLLDKTSSNKSETILYDRSGFVWTGSKNALIELIYAVYVSGNISHGKTGIRKICSLFQKLFQVQLGDIHHAFHRMKNRAGSRTIFLDQLKSSVEQYMDQEL